MNTRTYTYTHATHKHKHTHMYLYAYVHAYVCICIHTFIHMYPCIFLNSFLLTFSYILNYDKVSDSNASCLLKSVFLKTLTWLVLSEVSTSFLRSQNFGYKGYLEKVLRCWIVQSSNYMPKSDKILQQSKHKEAWFQSPSILNLKLKSLNSLSFWGNYPNGILLNFKNNFSNKSEGNEHTVGEVIKRSTW